MFFATFFCPELLSCLIHRYL